MSKITIILSSILLFCLLSCTRNEKIIDNSQIQQQYLVSTSGENPRLLLVDKDDGIINNNIYLERTGKKLSSSIDKIIAYMGNLYLIFKSEYKIEIINQDSFDNVAIIDFSDKLLEPTDISFANNGTDAFICHGNDSILTLFDIKNMKIAKTIKVGLHPVDITSPDNQVFVVNQADNTATIFHSSNIADITVMEVGAVPSLIERTIDWKKVLIVSLGYGKLDDSQQKTSAKISFVDVDKRKVTSTLEVGIRNSEAVNQYPLSLVLTKQDWAFILTETVLFRLDARKESSLMYIGNESFSMMYYDEYNDQLLLVKNEANSSELFVADAVNANSQFSFNFNFKISYVFSL